MKRALGSNVLSVDTYGKNILISFQVTLSTQPYDDVGEWRIYEKAEYDSGKAYIDLLWIHVWDPMTPIEDSLRVAGAASRMDEMGSGES
jgi:hypothetical protein